MRASGSALGGYSQHPDRRRHRVAYATVYAAYGLYEFPAAGRGVHSARPRCAADAGGRSAARPGARGSRRGRRLLAPLLVAPQSRIIGRSTSTSRSSLPRFCAGAARLWLLACASPQWCSAPPWTLPGTDVLPVTAVGAHVFNALAGFASPPCFWYAVCYTARRPSRARSIGSRCSRCRFIVARRHCLFWRARTMRRADRFCRSHRRDGRHRLAQRKPQPARCRWPRCSPLW